MEETGIPITPITYAQWLEKHAELDDPGQEAETLIDKATTEIAEGLSPRIETLLNSTTTQIQDACMKDGIILERTDALTRAAIMVTEYLMRVYPNAT
ncbi:MAG: hypothetical protein ABIE03_06330 [Patescibacteria group bacterium]|nr:hypothetical protein [Patescibacteria group bacterium]